MFNLLRIRGDFVHISKKVIFLKEAKIQHIQVTRNIVVHRKTGTGINEGNIVCLNNDLGLIFVDAGRVTQDAKKFRAEMEKKYKKKAEYLILTHNHGDHTFGAEAFKDLPIISSQKAYDDYYELEKEGKLSKEYRQGFINVMKEKAAKGEFELSESWHKDFATNYLAATLYPPTLAISDEMKLGSPEQQILFKVIGGHSDCSAYLYYLPEDILIAGDNFNCDHAQNSGCMLAGMNDKGIAILKLFEDLNPKKVIPGHGPVVEKDYIRTSRVYFSEMFAKLKELKEKGVSLGEASKHPGLPNFFEDKKHRQWDHIMSSWYSQL